MNEGPPKRTKKRGHLLLGGLTQAEFNKLRKEWYDRLKADGFSDEERIDKDGVSHDRQHSGLKFGYRDEDPVHPWTAIVPQLTHHQANELLTLHRSYYTRCLQFLHSSSRRRPKGHRQRAIWTLHADGKTVRAIAEEVGVSKSVVHKTIARCRILMELWWSDTASQRDAELQARTEEEHDETKVPNS